MRVLGYARVSSAEQALGTSLQDQQESIKRHAASLGAKVSRFYVEAESAVHERIERREQIRALMSEARAGDLIVVDKLDRWSRDIIYTLQSIRDLRARGASWFAVAERLDASQPDAQLALEMRAVFAAEEHRRIKIRTVGTRKLLREKGLYVEGSPPFGYRRRGGKGLDKNVLVVVPEEADVVRRVFALYARGRSMAQVGVELGRPLYDVKRILDRRIYTGESETSKGWTPTHEPIIDVRTFARTRALVGERTLGGARPRNAPSETDDWILRDVAICGRCSARMSAAYAGEKGSRRYYYRCSHRCRSRGTRATNGSYIPVESIEDEAAVLLRRHLGALRAEIGKAPPATKPTRDFDVARTKLQKKRTRLQEMYADEAMTRDELRAAMVRLDDERMKLDAEEEAPRPLSTRAERRAALSTVTALKGAWDESSAKQRRQIVNMLARDVALLAGEEPVPRWRPAADLDFAAIAALLVGE